MTDDITWKEISMAKKGFIKAFQRLYGDINGLENFAWYTYNHQPMVYGSDEWVEYEAHVRASKKVYEEIINDPQYEYIWKCKAMISRIKNKLKK